MFNLFRVCRKDEISFDIAVFGNKVECRFDKFERCFDIVAGVDGSLVSAGDHLAAYELLNSYTVV